MTPQSFDRVQGSHKVGATRREVTRGLGALALAVLAAPGLAGAVQDASSPAADDETAVRDIPRKVVDAWAQGNGEGVAAAFTADVDFIAGDGRLVQGREALIPYFQEQFDGWLKGSRSVADVINVRFLRDDVAVMHTLGGIQFPGEMDVQPEWVGIQTWIALKLDGQWLAAAYQNSRVAPKVQTASPIPHES